MQPAPNTKAPPELWHSARAFFCALHMLFGGPETVADRHTLAHKAYMQLLSWLRVGEAMMRRLIAIEAAAFPARAVAKPRTQHKHTRKPVSFCADKPEEWRVAFRCFLTRQRDASGQRKYAARRFHSAWPLAERYEALIRAFNDPLRAPPRRPPARRAAKISAPIRQAARIRAPRRQRRSVHGGGDREMAPARLQLARHTKSRTPTLRASHAGPHPHAPA